MVRRGLHRHRVKVDHWREVTHLIILLGVGDPRLGWRQALKLHGTLTALVDRLCISLGSLCQLIHVPVRAHSGEWVVSLKGIVFGCRFLMLTEFLLFVQVRHVLGHLVAGPANEARLLGYIHGWLTLQR